MFSILSLLCIFLALTQISGYEFVADIPRFHKALQDASGIYTHSGMFKESAPYHRANQTVIMAVANHGFLDMLGNFHCFTQRLNLKVLIISLDNRTHELDGKLSNFHSYLWKSESIQSAAASYRTRQFNIISVFKLYAVKISMELGFDVIFTDPDVVVVRDPIPYMIYQPMDFIYSADAHCWLEYDMMTREGNTGLYFVRSHPTLIYIFDKVIELGSRLVFVRMS